MVKDQGYGSGDGMTAEQRRTIEAAARVVSEADAILVGAGAGFGVDSGLPDFRGDRGFWRAYPPFAKLGYTSWQ